MISVLVVNGLTHCAPEKSVEPVQLITGCRSQINKHGCLVRDYIYARAAFNAADVESGSRIARGWIRNQAGNSASHGMDGVLNAKVAPGVAATHRKAIPIPARAQGSISDTV